MEDQLAAPFPTPPPFYKHFTKTNISRLRQLRKEVGTSQPDVNNSTNDHNPKDIDIFSLPPELRYLIPPETPADGCYRSFGASFDRNAPPETLASQGIEQLYPPQPSVKLNPQPHLISLTRSLLTSFLSLIGILSKNPELFQSKVEDLQTMMYNMHELINEYRPHQARESLILMMEERVEKLHEETRKITESKEKVEAMCKELVGEATRLPHADTSLGVNLSDQEDSQVERSRKRQRAAWDALHAMTIPDE